MTREMKSAVTTRRLRESSLTFEILRAIAVGATFAMLLAAPNMGVAIAGLLREDASRAREWERRRIREALRRLHERRYIRTDMRGGKSILIVTERGKERIREFEWDRMAMDRPDQRWDGKWRIIAFDIPEQWKRERVALSQKLAHLGFLPLQKSLFVYPFSCADEVDFLAEFLGVQRFVHVIEATDLGTAEGRARKHFDLL